MLPCLFSVLLTFLIQDVLKFEKKSVAKRLNQEVREYLLKLVTLLILLWIRTNFLNKGKSLLLYLSERKVIKLTAVIF
jgi:hypothetical protein